MTAAHHEFAFHRAFVLPAALVGVRPTTAHLRIEDRHLDVRFGPWRVRVPLSEIASAEVTGPYAWPKVIGPPHLSLADRGLTFATTNREGVCIRFRRPVRGIEPVGLLRHPALTVTVRDAPAVAELLDSIASSPTATGDAPLERALEVVHDELSGLPAAELRRRASARGIRRVSSMTKAELLERLTLDDEPDRDEAGSPGGDPA